MHSPVEFARVGISSVDGLGREWRRLESVCRPSFFTSWAWIGTLLTALPDTRQMSLLRGRSGGETVALALLGESTDRRHLGLVRSRSLNLNETGDPQLDAVTIEHNRILAPAGCEAAAANGLIEWFATQRAAADELHLTGSAERLPAAAIAAHSLNCVTTELPSYSVELARLRAADGMLTPILSRNARQQLARATRHFEQFGPLQLEIATTIDEALAFFVELKALHSATWQRRGKRHAFSQPFFEYFHRLLIARNFASGAIELSRVSAGSKIIGYLYNFRHGKTIYAYQSGFSEPGRGERPGAVCHALAIRRAFQAGAETYDFMAGYNRLKQSFSTTCEPMLGQTLQHPRLALRFEGLVQRHFGGWSPPSPALQPPAPTARLTFPPPKRLLTPPQTWPPTLTIVIDTEEEFDWSGPFDPASTSVTNIALQPLAQDIFDRHRVVPTYVVDYPVASTPASVATLRRFVEDGRAELGAHLHPWVNPPAEGPIDARHSYPGNLPRAVERRKLIALTETIAASFGMRPRVYKAGRYGIGPATPAILQELGYQADVSVVPHTDFSSDGGPDFRGAPAGPFAISDQLCEIPLSVDFVGRLATHGPTLSRHLAGPAMRRLRLGGVCARLGMLERLRLSPEDHSLADMVRQTRAALARGTRLFMLTYHSSSLLPGATDYVRSNAERDRFLAALDGYLDFFLDEVGGRTQTVSEVAAALMPSEPRHERSSDEDRRPPRLVAAAEPARPRRVKEAARANAGRALVFGEDTRAFLATVRSLGRQGIAVHAAPTDFRSPALRSRYISEIHDLPPWMAPGDEWLRAIEALLRRTRFDLVIPCNETAMLPLQRHRARLAPLARLAIPDDRAIAILFDKHETRELARRVGVRVAPGRLLRSCDTAEALFAEFASPVIIKPRRSYALQSLAARGKVLVVQDPVQLRPVLDACVPEETVIEQFFAGQGQGVSLLASKGRVLQAFEHHRVRETAGASFYRVSAPLSQDLLGACAAIVEATEYTGVAMFEFKRNAHRDWILLEVNARPWGSLPLPVALGVDFPYRWYRLLTAGEEAPPVAYRIGVYGRNLVPDLRAIWAEGRASHLGPVAWTWFAAQRATELLRPLAAREFHDVLVHDDPSPGLVELTEIAGSMRHRAGRHLPSAAIQRQAAKQIRRALGQCGEPLILFVCQGNICRSPFAEALLRAHLGKGALGVGSAGMMPQPGRPSPPLAREAAAAFAVDLSAHRSRWLSRKLADAATVIIVFDEINRAAVLDRYPDIKAPVIALGDLAELPAITDPIDGDAAEFRRIYGQIASAISELQQVACRSAQ